MAQCQPTPNILKIVVASLHLKSNSTLLVVMQVFKEFTLLPTS